MNNMIHKLIDWLIQCKAFNIQPVTIQIDDRTWAGARYKQTFVYTESMMACTHGEKKPGEPYTEEKLYVIGNRPNLKGKWCYPFEGVDWFIAGYIDAKQIKPQFVQFHPFGANFVMRPWDLSEPIDRYENKPYGRIPMALKSI